MTEKKLTKDGGSKPERSLGHKEALALGVGTMVGAGIFIFPGIAGGRAGLAAILSFSICAVIAIMVALPTSELATAMPRSGGGFYYVAKGLNESLGGIIGLGFWMGLVFAGAFYLMGFGFYASSLTNHVFGWSFDPRFPALFMVLTFVLIGVFSTRGAGSLQFILVAVLLAILFSFLALSLSNIFMPGGIGMGEKEFAPKGFTPVFTTAALVFTSYLGFAQIATSGGDIKDPNKTLPRSMVESVIIVSILYVLTVIVVVCAFSTQELVSFGETALIEAAFVLLGPVGAITITFAGIFATLSSANATIFGSSRTIFRLGKDNTLPSSVGVLNEAYDTPHIGFLLTGIPVLLFIMLGDLELLAEVASFLHLVLYGLICFSLINLRHKKPEWYKPVFVTPAYPFLPLIGGVASFALILFMNPLSQLTGVLLLGLATTFFFVRRKQRKSASEN